MSPDTQKLRMKFTVSESIKHAASLHPLTHIDDLHSEVYQKFFCPQFEAQTVRLHRSD